MSETMPAAAEQHLEAFLKALGVHMVVGSLILRFNEGRVQKVEATTVHSVRTQKAVVRSAESAHTSAARSGETRAR